MLYFSQGPVRKRKIPLDSFSKRNLIQGLYGAGDRGTEKPGGDGEASQRLKPMGSCYTTPMVEGTPEKAALSEPSI